MPGERPAGFIVGLRMSFEGHGMETGLNLDENIEIMNRLADDGIDYGHVSHLDLAAPSVKYPDQVALAYIRARVDRRLPIMAAGSVTSRAHAERALSLGASSSPSAAPPSETPGVRELQPQTVGCSDGGAAKRSLRPAIQACARDVTLLRQAAINAGRDVTRARPNKSVSALGAADQVRDVAVVGRLMMKMFW